MDLFCICNANDPTPTAYAIRSSTYDKVSVFVIGQERYGERQERALYRFKKWLSGSAKSSEDWPQGLWKDAWDWKKPEGDYTAQGDTLVYNYYASWNISLNEKQLAELKSTGQTTKDMGAPKDGKCRKDHYQIVNGRCVSVIKKTWNKNVTLFAKKMKEFDTIVAQLSNPGAGSLTDGTDLSGPPAPKEETTPGPGTGPLKNPDEEQQDLADLLG